MSKKYLFVFSLLVFVFNIAFISKAFGQNYIYNMPTAGTSFIEKKCTSNVLVTDQRCIAYTVTGFTDNILIGTYDADPNQTLIVHQDSYNPNNNYALPSPSSPKTFSSGTCSSPNDARDKTACQLSFTHNWGSLGVKTKNFITHDGVAQSNEASYRIEIFPAPITILGTLNGNSNFLWTTLDKDKTLNIQCTNSLSMKINGQEVATGSAGNGYTINYNFKDQNPKGATYTVVCSNVGTSKSVEFNTLDMTGNLSAANCKIPLGESSCSTLLDWSTQNELGTSEVTSPWPSAGTVVGNTNNGNKTVEIPHGSRNFYLYNSGSKLDEIEVFATCDNSGGGVEWDGTKCSRKEITTYLEAAGCIIPANASSCNGEVSWSITNSTTTVGLYKGSTLVSSNISGNNLSTSLPYGNTYFYLKHGGVTLKTSSTSTVCTSGTTWDGSKCALPAAAYTLSASTCTIASGGSSCTGTVTWKVTNPEGNISLAQYSINNPPEKTIYTGDTGTNKSTSLSYGQNSFTVKSNNTAKKTVEVSVACASGSTWNGSVCVPNTCPPERWNEASGACMTGAITLSTCSIAVGANSCNMNVSWSTQYPIGVSQVTSNYPSNNTVVANTNSGSQTVTIPYSSRTFFLYNNGVELDKKVASVGCVSGATWDGSKCASPLPSLSANNCIILDYESSCNSTLYWSVTNPIGNTAVTSNYPSENTNISTQVSGSQSVAIPYNSRYFFLYNNGNELAQTQVKASCQSGSSWNGSQCIPPAVTSSLSATNCTIPSGGSTCGGTVTWSTQNARETVKVNKANSTIYTGTSGTNKVTTLNYGTNTFNLIHGNDNLRTVNATASCAANTTWDGTKCASRAVTLTADNCLISLGANSCNTNLSWSVTNPIGNTAVTSNYPSENTNISTQVSGSQSIAIPYNSRYFFLYNNGDELAQIKVTSKCQDGTTWNGNKCSANTTGNLSAPNKCTINAGEDSCNVTISWGTDSPLGVPEVTSNTPSTNTSIATGNSGSKQVSIYYNGRTFFLYDNGQLLDSATVAATCISGSTWDSTNKKCVSPTPTLTANNCTIAIGDNSCNTNLSWSVTNPIGNTAVTSNYPSGNTTVSTQVSGSQSVAIPYDSRYFFLYNNGNELDQLKVSATCATGSTWDGSKCLNTSCPPTQIFNSSTKTCECPPSRPNMDSNGYCYADCYYGYDWNPEAKECLPKCPTGQLFVNNICMDINRQPICTWLDPFVNNFSKVTCDITFYPCGENKETVFNVLYKDGTANKTLPNVTTFEGPRNFNWTENQREYRYICPNGDFWYADALKRPYTHFMSFDVSAGQVKKGSTINLSWQVQLPNTTCKIVGTSLKDGTVKFDSANYSKIKNNITDPSLATLNYSNVGNFHTLIGSYLQVDESMRFVASCTDIGYNKGYSQLVRDVYVVDEADR